jgi:hypothetical protein
VDVVLGVSVADGVARLTLVDGAARVIDEHLVALSGPGDGLATILATRSTLNAQGHRLVGTRLSSPDAVQADRTRSALHAAGIGDVVVVTPTEASDDLAATIRASGATLSAVLPPMDSLGASLPPLTGPQLAYSQVDDDPTGVGYGPDGIPLQTPLPPLQDFTPWAAAEEDVPIVAPPGTPGRTRFLLVGSSVAGIAAITVAALAVSTAVNVQPTASHQADIGGPLTSYAPKPHVVDEAVEVPTAAPAPPAIEFQARPVENPGGAANVQVGRLPSESNSFPGPEGVIPGAPGGPDIPVPAADAGLHVPAPAPGRMPSVFGSPWGQFGQGLGGAILSRLQTVTVTVNGNPAGTSDSSGPKLGTSVDPGGDEKPKEPGKSQSGDDKQQSDQIGGPPGLAGQDSGSGGTGPQVESPPQSAGGSQDRTPPTSPDGREIAPPGEDNSLLPRRHSADPPITDAGPDSTAAPITPRAKPEPAPAPKPEPAPVLKSEPPAPVPEPAPVMKPDPPAPVMNPVPEPAPVMEPDPPAPVVNPDPPVHGPIFKLPSLSPATADHPKRGRANRDPGSGPICTGRGLNLRCGAGAGS